MDAAGGRKAVGGLLSAREHALALAGAFDQDETFHDGIFQPLLASTRARRLLHPVFLRSQWTDWEASFRNSGVTVIEIDRKPIEAALSGLYAKVVTDPHSKRLVESIQKDH